MANMDIFKMYQPDKDRCRFVKLEVEGVEVQFKVDTGCDATAVTLDQVRVWDLAHKIWKCRGFQFLTVDFRIGSRTFEANVIVLPGAKWNLLGTQILREFCCIIDLAADKLTFRNRIRCYKIFLASVKCEFGDKSELAVVDTGAPGFLYGRYSVAERLDLDLIDASEEVMITAVGGCYEGKIKYMAKDVRVKSMGKEASGHYYVIPNGLAVELVVGLGFLEGTRLEFQPDRGFKLIPDYSNSSSFPTLWNSVRPRHIVNPNDSQRPRRVGRKGWRRVNM